MVAKKLAFLTEMNKVHKVIYHITRELPGDALVFSMQPVFPPKCIPSQHDPFRLFILFPIYIHILPCIKL